jgi:osmotically inducible lipoprotein OsmB
MTRTFPLALALSAALLTSACQMSRTQERVLTGTAIGAGVGAGIGALSGGLDMGTGAVIGGIVGAGGGLVYDAVKK